MDDLTSVKFVRNTFAKKPGEGGAQFAIGDVAVLETTEALHVIRSGKAIEYKAKSEPKAEPKAKVKKFKD